jgi:hypothetical protein
MKSLTPLEIRSLSPENFRTTLAEIERNLASLSVEFTRLAHMRRIMQENCCHTNHFVLPHAKLCKDCGEYYAVDTSYSAETERWFAEQHRIANKAGS